MSTLTLQGTLSHGEGCGGNWGGGCSGSAVDSTYSLGFGACPKGAARAIGTGPSKRTIASPGAFVALEGVPTTVTRPDFLYLHSNAAIELRLTTDDGLGGDVVSVVPVQGIFMVEFPAAKYLKLVEVKGSAEVAYLVTGPS